MPPQPLLSRRAFVIALPVIAAIASCGFRRTATADELLVNGIIAEKLALLPHLTSFPEVATQQQRHIDVLSGFTNSAPTSAATAAPTIGSLNKVAQMSAQHMAKALTANSKELRRILLLIAASESVHAKVIA